jgi:hypothetical protein
VTQLSSTIAPKSLSKEIAVLRGPYSRDGSRMATASADKIARVWDAHLLTMSVQDLLAQACARLTGVTKLTRGLASQPDSVP